MHTYICTHIYACIGMCTHDKNKYRDSQTGDAGSILEGRRWPRKTESRVFPSYPSTNTLSSPLLIWTVMFNLTLWGGGDRSQRGSTKSLQAIGWWWCTKCLSFSPPPIKEEKGEKGWRDWWYALLLDLTGLKVGADWEWDSVEIYVYIVGGEEAGQVVQKKLYKKTNKIEEEEFTVLEKCGTSL